MTIGIDKIKEAQARVVSRRLYAPYTFARCPNKGQNTAHCRFCGHAHRSTQAKVSAIKVSGGNGDCTTGKQVGDMIEDGFRMLRMMGD